MLTMLHLQTRQCGWFLLKDVSKRGDRLNWFNFLRPRGCVEHDASKYLVPSVSSDIVMYVNVIIKEIHSWMHTSSNIIEGNTTMGHCTLWSLGDRKRFLAFWNAFHFSFFSLSVWNVNVWITNFRWIYEGSLLYQVKNSWLFGNYIMFKNNEKHFKAFMASHNQTYCIPITIYRSRGWGIDLFPWQVVYLSLGANQREQITDAFYIIGNELWFMNVFSCSIMCGKNVIYCVGCICWFFFATGNYFRL